MNKKLTPWKAFTQSMNTVNLSLLATLGALCLFLVPLTPPPSPVVLVLLCLGFSSFIGAFLGGLISLGFIDNDQRQRKEGRCFLIELALTALFIWGWHNLVGLLP